MQVKDASRDNCACYMFSSKQDESSRQSVPSFDRYADLHIWISLVFVLSADLNIRLGVSLLIKNIYPLFTLIVDSQHKLDCHVIQMYCISIRFTGNENHIDLILFKYICATLKAHKNKHAIAILLLRWICIYIMHRYITCDY